MADTWPKKPQHLIITLDRHFGLFMTWPIVVPGYAWHLGFAQEGWSKTLGTNKWNDDVLADGVPIASLGNAPEHCLVPHLNMFPFGPWHPNLLIPILILTSSNESFIAVGSVVAKQGPIAVSLPFVKVLGLNLACNDPVTMPTDIVIMPSSTVVLGFTLGDLIAALLRYGLQLLIDFLMKKLNDAIGKWAKQLKGKLGKKLLGSNNRFGRWAGRILSPTKVKTPPGRFKRAALDWMGKMGINKTFRNPATGRFDSVFDRVAGDLLKETRGFVNDQFGIPTTPKQVLDKVGVPTSAGDAFGMLKDRFLPPGEGYNPSMYDRVGAFIDGRSEMLYPTLPGASPSP